MQRRSRAHSQPVRHTRTELSWRVQQLRSEIQSRGSDHAEAFSSFIDGEPQGPLKLLVRVVVGKAELVETVEAMSASDEPSGEWHWLCIYDYGGSK